MPALRALIADDELLARRVIGGLLQADDSVEVVGEASTGTETVLQALHLRPDLLFLDIQMPELNGFEVLQHLWPHHRPAVIFTTAYDSYAIRAFDINAVDYLLKPFTELRFRQALERVRHPQAGAAVGQLLAQAPAAGPGSPPLHRILVKDNRKLFFVRTDDVLYFDADGNYIKLHTVGRTCVIYETLAHLEARLDPRHFVRINRSYIVNLNYVKDLETYFNGEYLVKMTNGDTLKWTRSYRDNIKAFLTRETNS